MVQFSLSKDQNEKIIGVDMLAVLALHICLFTMCIPSKQAHLGVVSINRHVVAFIFP